MEKTQRKKLFAAMACLTAALIWGLAFSFQDHAARTLDSFAINSIRSFIGALVLVPTVVVFDLITKNGRKLFSTRNPAFIGVTRREVLGGFLCAIALSAASYLQQAGLATEEVSAANTAFITVLYVVIVPILARILGRRQPLFVWISAAIAVAGFFLMAYDPKIGFSFAPGDLLVLAAAVMYAVHILIIDHFLDTADPIRLSMIQFFFVGWLLFPFMIFVEGPSMADIVTAAPFVLYLGVMSCGVAFTLQNVGQRFAPPAAAAMLISLESVFGAIGGAIILGESMTVFEIIGSIAVFLAMLLSQFADNITAWYAKKKG